MKLSDIKGLGESSIARLSRAGIETPLDLVMHFPHKYVALTKAALYGQFEEGDDFAVYGTLEAIASRRFGGKSIVTGEFVSDGVRFRAVWFNQPYIAKSVRIKNSYYIIGKMRKIAQKTQKNSDIRFELSAPILKAPRKMRPVLPVYTGTGIGRAAFENAVEAALKSLDLCSFIPTAVGKKFGLMDVKQAFISAHFPQTIEEATAARESLSLENLALHIALFMSYKQKINGEQVKTTIYSGGDCDNAAISMLNKTVDSLEFELTVDQKTALNRIIALMNGKNPMNALLQGDVGCGKTIVCFLAMKYAAFFGYQSVLMAPTEILARQHYQKAIEFFGAENVEFLCGSLKPAVRDQSRFNIKHGMAKIIIGTHSVFSEGVEFKNLALVITDEQHRFGVGQRGALQNKADNPDCIVMSATPIPRTVSLTMYGDLEPITIKTKPQKKAKIFTRFVQTKIKEMYDYAMKKAQNGEKTFIVCPRINEKDEDDEDDDSGLTSAITLFKELKKGALGDKIILLHGRMKEQEKIAAMDAFANGDKMIMVATTVIEVGIDIPAATTMIIYNAEMYGLSQLHQLRGRIGRGAVDSYCFLLCSAAAYENRLNFLEHCDDGFELAERDFEIRGAGDFLGFKQHGKSTTITGIKITAALLNRARQLAAEIPESSLTTPKQTLQYFNDIALN